MSYTLEELQQLMESFQKSGLTGFRYSTEEGTLSFRNERHSDPMERAYTMDPEEGALSDAPGHGAFDAGGSFAGGQHTASGDEGGAAKGNEPLGTDPERKGLVLVKAPIAGIFYRASKPGEKPYVEEGQRVKKGDIVGLVEAMKMMNEIPSPCDGVIQEIRVEDSVFTEYGAVLMTIGEN